MVGQIAIHPQIFQLMSQPKINTIETIIFFGIYNGKVYNMTMTLSCDVNTKQCV